MRMRVLFGLGKLEHLQDVIANRLGVGQRLETGSVALEFVVIEVAVSRPRRKNEIVVRDPYVGPFGGARDDEALLLVPADYVSERYGDVPLVAENATDGSADLSRRQD